MSESAFEGIAIVGLHGRFPGANSVEEFWENLIGEKDGISHFSDAQLRAAGVDADAIREGCDYVSARGILKGAESFDAAFFGISPKEAEVMEPQHRVFLEGCWEALERAGYAPDRIDVPVGIFAGATYNSYYLHALHTRPHLLDMVGAQQVMFGNEKDYLATRVAYKLNLTGPAITIDTACSSSLTAVCQACQSLLTFQSDMAIAGGVSVVVPQETGYVYREGFIASPDGRTRPFDARAQGTVLSNGLALVVLKRLEDAEADGDQIYGVLRGFALNNDGKMRVSLGAPGVEGQAEVIAMAQEIAGVNPDEFSYIEAHGTATPVGDPIEVTALTKAFRRQTDKEQFCAIGSVKGNIGHLDVAAGAAGLIKTALSLKQESIPPTLYFTKPNPRLELESSPFFVNQSLREWKREEDKKRYAGVSSFGLGGTNAHVVVEEPPRAAPSGPSRATQLIILSAKSERSLEESRKNLAEHLRLHPGENMADVAFTLQVGRSPMEHRCAFTCRDSQDALTVLEDLDSTRLKTQKRRQNDPSIIFMFPGQGAQHAGMGRDLYHSEGVFRETVDQCSELLRPILDADLRDTLFHPDGNAVEANELIKQTRLAQPAIFVIEYALAKLWMSWGIHPTAMIGHSVGEYVAACLASVFELEDALNVIAERGRLLQSMPAGSMMAVRLPETELRAMLRSGLDIAAINSPNLCVVSGPHDEVTAFESDLADRSVTSKRLRTSHAFHSSMMDGALDPLTHVLERIEFGKPSIPFISNLTSDWITDGEAMSAGYWAQHVRQAVRFSEGLEKIMTAHEGIILEVGPGESLANLAKQNPAYRSNHVVLSSLERPKDRISLQETDGRGPLDALAKTWLAGAEVDWTGFYSEERRHRVVLPTYPFERLRCWPSGPAQGPAHPGRYAPTAPMASASADERPPTPSNPTPSVTPTLNTSSFAPSPDLEMAAGAPPAQHPRPTESLAAPYSEVSRAVRTAGPARRERLIIEILGLMRDLTGKDLAPEDANVELTEFGFDSLLLTQAATLLRRKYRIRITFRQLMEELSTIESIAASIDSSLPEQVEGNGETADAGHVVASRSGYEQGSPGSISGNPKLGDPTANGLDTALQGIAIPNGLSAVGSSQSSMPRHGLEGYEAHLAQHLSMASQILQQMQQERAEVTRQLPHVAGGPGTPSMDSMGSGGIFVSENQAAAMTPTGQRRSHGPYRPLEKCDKAELSADQRERLDAFIDRYTTRTKGSKALAEKNRPLLADPRSVTGFKSIWKEAVYSIHAVRSEGSRIWDVDGNEYVDFIMGFGASLFGHRPPFLIDAVKDQLDLGFETGPMHPLAGEVARLFQEMTGAERIAFCSTGSEAVLAAIRIARTASARDKIVMFEGAYHGIFDEILARPSIRNGELRSIPTAPGIPDGTFGEIIVLRYGCPESLEIIERYGDEIAAVLVEPVQGRRLDLVPGDFLLQLREITTATGSALVFDEIVTGFRVAPGGAQEFFGIEADIATYGKVVGGGIPIGIVAGKASYLDVLDGGEWHFGDDSNPEVGVTFFAGTFVRHPLALAAAKSVLTHLRQQGGELQRSVAEKAQRVATEFRRLFAEYDAPYHLSHFSSLLFISVPPESHYGSLIFVHLRDRGIHMFENRLFVFTTVHTPEDEQSLIRAMEESLQEMQRVGLLEHGIRPTVDVPPSPQLPGMTPPHPDSSVTSKRKGRETIRVADSTTSNASGTANGSATAPRNFSEMRIVNSEESSTLEEIQPEGSRPPLFCMPAADGLTLVYHELADRLGPDQPVYGLNAPGAIGEPFSDSFELMAERYVRDIKALQPHGPYLLVGYCSGGSIALEVAQQMVASGEPVSFVCGIETYDWSTAPLAKPSLLRKLDFEMQRLYFHTRNFLSSDRGGKLAFLRSKLHRMKSRIRVWKGSIASLFHRQKNRAGGSTDWSELWRHLDAISVKYFPKRYPGELLLIRARTDYRSYVGEKDFEADEGVRRVRIAAFPACTMTPPHVDQVAKLVEDSIAEGLRRYRYEACASDNLDAAAGDSELQTQPIR